MTHTTVNNCSRPIVFLISFLFLLSCNFFEANANQVCMEDNCFVVELAQTQQEWAKGLMDRKSLDQNRGMLFIFPYPQKHSFWMKNTLISLDMIWLDYTKRVIHIEENVAPCRKDPCKRYAPSEDALYVLELNAGQAKRAGIKKGRVLEFKLKKESL